jgi:hypothetical protein
VNAPGLPTALALAPAACTATNRLRPYVTFRNFVPPLLLDRLGLAVNDTWMDLSAQILTQRNTEEITEGTKEFQVVARQREVGKPRREFLRESNTKRKLM